FLRLLVIAPHDSDHLASHHAGSRDHEALLVLALEHGQDDRIALNEDFARAVLRQQLVYWLIEIQAEIRGGVQSPFEERSRQVSRISDVRLKNYVAAYFVFRWLLLFHQQEFV